jgi:hypothetical protein
VLKFKNKFGSLRVNPELLLVDNRTETVNIKETKQALVINLKTHHCTLFSKTYLDHLHMLKLLGCQIMVKENDENEDSLMLPNAAV